MKYEVRDEAAILYIYPGLKSVSLFVQGQVWAISTHPVVEILVLQIRRE